MVDDRLQDVEGFIALFKSLFRCTIVPSRLTFPFDIDATLLLYYFLDPAP